MLPSMARCGVAAVRGVLLRGLALAGDVAAVADGPRPRRASASAGPAARSGRSGPWVSFDFGLPRPATPGRPSRAARPWGRGRRGGSGSRDQRHRVEQVLERPGPTASASAQAWSTLPSAAIRATKPSWRVTGSLAAGRHLLERRRGRGRARRRGGRSGAGRGRRRRPPPGSPSRSSWRPDRVDQDAAARPSCRSFARSASASRRNSSRTPLAEEQLEVDRPVALHLEQLVGGHVAAGRTGRRRSLVKWIGCPSATAFFQYGSRAFIVSPRV